MFNPVANDRIQAYFEALKRYTEDIRIPGLDLTSGPLPLEQIFVAPQVGSGRVDKEGLGDDFTDRRPLWARRMILVRDRILISMDTGRPESSGAPESQMIEAEPVGRVLGREPRLVILGEPGQGKTTVLRQYASSLLGDGERPFLPLLVELGRKREIGPEDHQDFLLIFCHFSVQLWCQDAFWSAAAKPAIFHGKLSAMLA